MPETTSDTISIPNSQPKCENKEDIENLLLQTHDILGHTNIIDWFANRITEEIQTASAHAPDEIEEDLRRLAAVTAQYDSELDEANQLCVKSIRAQLKTIRSLKTIEDIISNAHTSNVTDFNDGCLVIQKALAISVRERDIMLTCAEDLRRSVTPDHEMIVDSVKNVIVAIQIVGASSNTEGQIQIYRDQLRLLEDKIHATIHTDEKIVAAAGEVFRLCIYNSALNLDLGLARVAGSLDIVFDGVPQSDL